MGRTEGEFVKKKPTVILVDCTGKSRFVRFGQAERAAKNRNRKDGGAHLEPYFCRHCQGFHVGEARSYKQPKPKRGNEE